MGSCQTTCNTQKNSTNCCGYGKANKMQIMFNKDYPERAAMQKNRRWNESSKCIAEKPLLTDDTNFIFDDEKVTQFLPIKVKQIKIDVIDDKLFDKFDTKSKDTIFGYIRDIETILNQQTFKSNHPQMIESPESSIADMEANIKSDKQFQSEGVPDHNDNNESPSHSPSLSVSEIINLDLNVDFIEIRIPNNIHYLILLYFYLMENEFENEALVLWESRADISEFMNTTLKSTRTRMWDKFDKHRKEMLSTEKYLPKFIYTISVLHLKSKQRKSIPPKYSKVKNCCKYMALLIIQSLPIDQRKYIDKQSFVDNIHVYLSSIC